MKIQNLLYIAKPFDPRETKKYEVPVGRRCKKITLISSVRLEMTSRWYSVVIRKEFVKVQWRYEQQVVILEKTNQKVIIKYTFNAFNDEGSDINSDNEMLL